MRAITYWINKETGEKTTDVDLVLKNEDNYIEKTKYVMSPFERQEAAVYATGNKWAIENWNATHY